MALISDLGATHAAAEIPTHRRPTVKDRTRIHQRLPRRDRNRGYTPAPNPQRRASWLGQCPAAV